MRRQNGIFSDKKISQTEMSYILLSQRMSPSKQGRKTQNGNQRSEMRGPNPKKSKGSTGNDCEWSVLQGWTAVSSEKGMEN